MPRRPKLVREPLPVRGPLQHREPDRAHLRQRLRRQNPNQAPPADHYSVEGTAIVRTGPDRSSRGRATIPEGEGRP